MIRTVLRIVTLPLFLPWRRPVVVSAAVAFFLLPRGERSATMVLCGLPCGVMEVLGTIALFTVVVPIAAVLVVATTLSAVALSAVVAAVTSPSRWLFAITVPLSAVSTVTPVLPLVRR